MMEMLEGLPAQLSQLLGDVAVIAGMVLAGLLAYNVAKRFLDTSEPAHSAGPQHPDWYEENGQLYYQGLPVYNSDNGEWDRESWGPKSQPGPEDERYADQLEAQHERRTWNDQQWDRIESHWESEAPPPPPTCCDPGTFDRDETCGECGRRGTLDAPRSWGNI